MINTLHCASSVASNAILSDAPVLMNSEQEPSSLCGCRLAHFLSVSAMLRVRQAHLSLTKINCKQGHAKKMSKKLLLTQAKSGIARFLTVTPTLLILEVAAHTYMCVYTMVNKNFPIHVTLKKCHLRPISWSKLTFLFQFFFLPHPLVARRPNPKSFLNKCKFFTFKSHFENFEFQPYFDHTPTSFRSFFGIFAVLLLEYCL